MTQPTATVSIKGQLDWHARRGVPHLIHEFFFGHLREGKSIWNTYRKLSAHVLRKGFVSVTHNKHKEQKGDDAMWGHGRIASLHPEKRSDSRKSMQMRVACGESTRGDVDNLISSGATTLPVAPRPFGGDDDVLRTWKHNEDAVNGRNGGCKEG
ncbi:hypothetical protein L596_002087 [Steinernema carpocapsae]|uniref:Uncharacterized protein n=1 Tax=Steinernema carpocapsae TaxID=34508 RepID=A0A4U8UP74_STECR|nr:hypothetical protein L596_002087 [Steinernema carpocapsae]